MEAESGDKVTVVMVVVVAAGLLNPLINVWASAARRPTDRRHQSTSAGVCVPRLASPCRCYLGAAPVVFKSLGTTYCCPVWRWLGIGVALVIAFIFISTPLSTRRSPTTQHGSRYAQGYEASLRHTFGLH